MTNLWAIKDSNEQPRPFVTLILQKQPGSLSFPQSSNPVWLCGWTPAQHSKIVGQLEASDLLNGRRGSPALALLGVLSPYSIGPFLALLAYCSMKMCLWNSANFTETDWTLLDNSAAFVWNRQSWSSLSSVPQLWANKANSRAMRFHTSGHVWMPVNYQKCWHFERMFVSLYAGGESVEVIILGAELSSRRNGRVNAALWNTDSSKAGHTKLMISHWSVRGWWFGLFHTSNIT